MVDAGDGSRKPHAQQPADGRHQALESAEVEPSQQIMPEVLFPAGQTLADGYSKGIHGKPHRNEKQLNQTHILLPLSYQIRSLHCMSGQLPDRTGLPFCGSCAVMRQPSGRIGLPGQNWALLPSDSRPQWYSRRMRAIIPWSVNGMV